MKVVICRNVSKVFIQKMKRGYILAESGQPFLQLFTAIISRTIRGYVKRTIALRNVSLDIKEGEIVGILGTNGSGKTTLLKIISGLIYPSEGEVYVYGYDIVRDYDKVSDKVFYITGALIGGFGISPLLSVRKNLEYIFKLYRIPKERVDDAIKILDLKEHAERPLGYLSPGLASRVILAPAFFIKRALYLLDEPIQGISFEAAKKIHEYIRESRDIGGATILYATNNIFEVENLCDRFIILDKGKILAGGELKELISKLALKTVVKVTVEGDINLEDLTSIFGNDIRIESKRGVLQTISLFTSDVTNTLIEIAKTFGNKNIIKDIQVKSPTIGDVFLHYVKLSGEQYEEKRKICLQVF